MSNNGKTFPAEAYTTAEVEALMAACSPTSATGKRNRALIATLWRGALRCEEALQLKLHDLDQATGTIRILHGKGDRARTVGIDPPAWAVIELWLITRKALGVPRSVPVFCTITNGEFHPLGSRYVRWLMADLGAKAQIGKRVHAHGLRHSRAVEMRREGKDLLVISRALGHSNVATTQRYIEHLYPDEVIKAMHDSQWARDSQWGRDGEA